MSGAVITFLGLVSLCSAADSGAAMRQYDLNIPRQSLDLALKDLIAETDVQVVRFSDAVKGDIIVGPLQDKLSAPAALDRLLAPAGLTYRPLSDNAFIILTLQDAAKMDARAAAGGGGKTNANSQETAKEAGKTSSHDFRVAQVDQTSAEPQIGQVKEEKQQAPQLEEVIVTAQKREERLIDVPISIAAISGKELQNRQITTLEDLPSIVPGLAIADTGSGRQIFLRGVTNTVGTSLIGMYLDEADVTLGGGTNNPALNPGTYDLERVEVLRGPQGTLYGEGSAGGTIRFISNKPELSRFAFDADVAALFTQRGAPSQRINSMVNVPLIDGQLGLRIAGTFNREGAWIDQPAADLRDINGRDLTNVRVEGLWKPSSQFTVSTIAVISRDDRGPDISDTDSPGTFTQVFDLTTTPREKNDYNLYNLTLSYDFPAARIISATSYIESNITARNLSQSYNEGTPPVLYEYYVPLQTTKDDAFTQELRLTSGGSELWQWTLGGFYRDYHDSNRASDTYFSAPGPLGTPLSSYGSSPFGETQMFRSWSVFGNTSYTFWDHLTLGAGVRYFRDHQNVTDDIQMVQREAEFQSTDPRVYAQYKAAKNINLYASASKGFRSGGFNYPVTNPTYAPESLWTYELGTKMSLADGRLSADTAVFWTNYTDYQTLGVVSGTPAGYFSNSGSARIKGVEWDLTWRPLDGVSLSANGDYVDGRFTQASANYNVGDSLDLSPKYQFTLSAERDFAWNGKQGFVRVDYSEQGRASYRLRTAGPSFYYQSDVIDLLSLHASLQWNDNLRLGLFAQNLLDEQGFVSPYWGLGNGIRPRPRTLGIEFGVTFK